MVQGQACRLFLSMCRPGLAGKDPKNLLHPLPYRSGGLSFFFNPLSFRGRRTDMRGSVERQRDRKGDAPQYRLRIPQEVSPTPAPRQPHRSPETNGAQWAFASLGRLYEYTQFMFEWRLGRYRGKMKSHAQGLAVCQGINKPLCPWSRRGCHAESERGKQKACFGDIVTTISKPRVQIRAIGRQ